MKQRKELPITGLKKRALTLLSQLDQFMDTHQRNYQRDPPVISLFPQQWKLLETGLETTDLELGDCTYRGIRLRQVEESPGAGRPGNL
jgi:hypothetical protein